MWIKRNERELKQELCKRWLGHAFFALTIAYLVCEVAFPPDGVKFSTKGRVLALLAAGVLLMAWQRRTHRRQIISRVLICEKCCLVKEDDVPGTCSCGGTWKREPELKWLEMPPCATGRPSLVNLESNASLSSAASTHYSVGPSWLAQIQQEAGKKA
jgi:hypothetical protein